MSSEYIPPDWAGCPSEEQKWTAELIHNGETIQKAELGRGFYLLGRQEEMVNIALPVVSSSRVHAALQYNDRGEIFLYDMASANGTYLNRKKLEPKTHVIVPDGSVITFAGDKSCLLILSSPPQDNVPDSSTVLDAPIPKETPPEEPLIVSGDLNEEQMQQVLEGNTEAQSKAQDTFSSRSGSSTQPVSHLSMHRFTQNSRRERHWLEYVSTHTLTDRETASFDKLLLRLRKIQALKTDSQRLQEKELTQGELTQGQLQALNRSMESLEALEPRFQSDEQDFRERLEARYPGITGPGFVSLMPGKKASRSGAGSTGGSSGGATKEGGGGDVSSPVRMVGGQVDARYSSMDVFGASDWNDSEDIREAHGASRTESRKKFPQITLRRGSTVVGTSGGMSSGAEGKKATVVDSILGKGVSGKSAPGKDAEPVYETEDSLLQRLKILEAENRSLGQEREKLFEEVEKATMGGAEEALLEPEEDALDRVLRESAEQADKDILVSKKKRIEEINKRLVEWEKEHSRTEILLRVANPSYASNSKTRSFYSSEHKLSDNNSVNPIPQSPPQQTGTKRPLSEA